MTDVYKLVECFARGLTQGFLTTHPAPEKEAARKTPSVRKGRTVEQLPGQLHLDFTPPPLPESLQVREENMGEPIAPGAGVFADMPAPPLTQRQVEQIEAVLRGEVPPDTYVPDNVEMEKKVGA